MQTAVAGILSLLLGTTPNAAARPFEGMLQLTLDGRTIEGTPVAWDASQVYFLERDGRLREFAPEDAANYRKISTRFRSYSVAELRASLLGELGGDFEVTGTSHYLVAHRRGQRDRWAERFEDLYRSFVHYFSVRGFTIGEPPFPLIGIVCRDQRDFARYLARLGTAVPPDVMGFYMLESNRIILYDMQTEEQWQRNAAVILHEAAHQAAFNTGIHSRYSPPPLWVAEGLASMFEAPGVYDTRYHREQSDRINRQWLEAFRVRVTQRLRPEMLAALIASDRSFRSDPAAAYALAWTLSFYLVETQPRQYTKYLGRTADHPPLSRDSADRRTADFASVFGDDWPMLRARLLRFVEELD